MNEEYYYINDNGDIIITDWKCKFPKGFLPKKKQKIFWQCPECKTLLEIKLGQGEICEDNICPECDEDFGDTTSYELFEPTDTYFIYSHYKYVKAFTNRGNDLNSNIKLSKEVGKIIGEPFFETIWKLGDDKLTEIDEFIREDLEEDIVLINKNDADLLLYLKYKNTPLDRVYVTNAAYNLTVEKLKHIAISVNIEVEL